MSIFSKLISWAAHKLPREAKMILAWDLQESVGLYWCAGLDTDRVIEIGEDRGQEISEEEAHEIAATVAQLDWSYVHDSIRDSLDYELIERYGPEK